MRSPSPHAAAASQPAATSLIEALVARLHQTRHLVCGHQTLAVSAVHEARKNLKNIRAGLRMLSDAGSVDLGQANALCRDVGRLLSGLRDTDVCLLTLEGLVAATPNAREKLAARLRTRREELHEASAPDPRAQREIAADLAGVEQVLRGLDPGRFDESKLSDAVDLSRQLGERRYQALTAGPEPERFHDVRKAAKRELYQRRYLAGAEGAAEQRIELLDCLGEHLGRHQDLCVLRGVAEDLGELSEALADVIDAEIVSERAQCLAMAGDAYGGLE